MVERAVWARNEFIKHPKNSQIDDEQLIWCFNKKDGFWYSIIGNYSSSSPEEKRIKNFEKEQKIESLNNFYDKENIKKLKELEYWSKVRKIILERDNYTCQICGKKGESKLHIHHILKRLAGGQNFYDNLITVCPSCHAKADRGLYNPNWQ